jgi:ABC-type dipeptide/oligopeptide/nickel transport system permease subunit
MIDSLRRRVRAVPILEHVTSLRARVKGSMVPAAPHERKLWGRFWRSRNAVIGTVIVGLLAGVAIGAPWLAPHDPVRNDLTVALRPPASPGFILGTDDLGRDMLSRIIWGSRISLSVGLGVEGIAVVIGTALGLLAGFYGGWADGIVSGATNIMFALPRLLFALAIIAALGSSLASVFIALGIVGWPTVCRLIRAEALSIRPKEFVDAARATGAGDRRIIFRHVLPNALGPLIVIGTLGVAHVMLAEASLSFLGLGAQPPTPSWGTMLSGGQAYVWSAPWLTVLPGLAIFIAVLGLNLLGDGLRDVLDPRVGG